MTPNRIAQDVLKVIVMALAVAIASCSDEPPTIPDDVIPAPSEIKETIDAAGPPEQAREPREEVEVSEKYEKLPGGFVWRCTEEDYDIVGAPDDYPVFNPNAEWLYPGCLLQGNTIGSPTPAILPLARGPGEICINNLTGADKPCGWFSETSMSNVIETANAIIGSQPAEFPGVTGFEYEYFESENQLRHRLDVSASFLGLFKTKASFSRDSYDHCTFFLVTFKQQYYTLMFEPPNPVDNLFGPRVTANDISSYISKGNPPVWVSSVTYGRLCYFIIESTETRSDVEASVSASFIFGGFEGEVKHVSQLEGLRVYALFIGGSASSAIDAVRGGMSTLDRFLDALQNPTLGTASPLSYQLRAACEGYPVVKNGYATQYVTRLCELVESPDYSMYKEFSLHGNGTISEEAPNFEHPNKISFVSALSYDTGPGDADDDYAFHIQPATVHGRDVYTISTGIGKEGSRVYGRIVTWGLPDFIEVGYRPILEIDGRTFREHYVPERPGMGSMTIVELLTYWTNGNDKLQFYCTPPSPGDPYVRIGSDSENSGQGESMKFRVTTLYWPEDEVVNPYTRAVFVDGDGDASLELNHHRVIVSPLVYIVNGDHDYDWDFAMDRHSVTVHTTRGRPGARMGAFVFELDLW